MTKLLNNIGGSIVKYLVIGVFILGVVVGWLLSLIF